jgi:hypothetical protein
MDEHRFFTRDGLDLSRGDVYFESTRADKIARIRAIGCSDFIDDLEEVFLEPLFPADVTRILYAPCGASGSTHGINVMPTWQAVLDHVFVDRCA